MAAENKMDQLNEGIESKQRIAYQQIKEDILNNTYPAGTVLAERKLCEIYRVSRSPIRNALQQLIHEGLLTVVPGKGAMVADFSIEDILEVYDLIEIHQLYAVRSLSARIDPAFLDFLQTTLAHMQKYMQEGNLPKSIQWDQRFHQFLITSSANKRLAVIYDQLESQSLRFMATILEDQKLAERSFEEHQEIFDSLKRHDLDHAQEGIRRHYKNIKQYYVDKLINRIQI